MYFYYRSVSNTLRIESLEIGAKVTGHRPCLSTYLVSSQSAEWGLLGRRTRICTGNRKRIRRALLQGCCVWRCKGCRS